MQPFRLIFLPLRRALMEMLRSGRARAAPAPRASRRAVSRGRCVLARRRARKVIFHGQLAGFISLGSSSHSSVYRKDRQGVGNTESSRGLPSRGREDAEWSPSACSSRAAATASRLLPAAGCLFQAERTGVGTQPVSVPGPAVVCRTALCFHSCFLFLGNKNIFLPD